MRADVNWDPLAHEGSRARLSRANSGRAPTQLNATSAFPGFSSPSRDRIDPSIDVFEGVFAFPGSVRYAAYGADMTATAPPILAVKDLTSGYGDLMAIRGISFEVHPGEIVAMFGANGAGKTTTLLACVGELPRSKGEVYWRGEKASKSLYKLARSGLAFVPEAPSIISGLSAHDNLRIGRGSVDLALTTSRSSSPCSAAALACFLVASSRSWRWRGRSLASLTSCWSTSCRLASRPLSSTG